LLLFIILTELFWHKITSVVFPLTLIVPAPDEIEVVTVPAFAEQHVG
jgi:hypothetical protein